jgi:hypothetical protein
MGANAAIEDLDLVRISDLNLRETRGGFSTWGYVFRHPTGDILTDSRVIRLFGRPRDVIGWGAWIRTRGWRNQNPLDYRITSKGIWKKSVKTRSSNVNSLADISK